MPITEELKNVKKYESVGFTHEQAETLAETIEQAQVSGNESLKEFIRSENDKLRGEIKDSESRLRGEIKDLESRLRGEINDLRYDLLLKIIVVVSSATGLLFTAIKLFT